MGRHPQVSVIIPAYNRAHTLSRAIGSVLSQTASDLELIVVDDASTDHTPELVKQLDDPRVRYTRHDSNRFAAAARNTGMRMANGEFIAFLDSDDEWMCDKLERQLAAMQDICDDCRCCYTGATLIDAQRSHSRSYRPKHAGDVLAPFLTNRFIVWTPTFLFRRSCLDSVGLMDETLVRCEDRDFYVRLFEQFRVVVIPDELVRIYTDSANPATLESRAGRIAFLKKHEQRISQLGTFWSRYVHAFQWCLQAEQEFSTGQLSWGCRSLMTSLQFNPFLPAKRYAALAVKAARGLHAMKPIQH